MPTTGPSLLGWGSTLVSTEKQANHLPVGILLIVQVLIVPFMALCILIVISSILDNISDLGYMEFARSQGESELKNRISLFSEPRIARFLSDLGPSKESFHG